MTYQFDVESDELLYQEEDDNLRFFDEPEEEFQIAHGHWKILIVDDEQEVHQVTKMVLSDVTFEGKGLTFFHAYSASEAKQLLEKETDIAVILLDVVMESDDSGLMVVEYIRHQLQNSSIRIILRTGQPGQAPEKRVIVDFDINDYKEKTELTSQKLFTTIISMLRSYRDLEIIEYNKKGLEDIIYSTSHILKINSKQQLVRGIFQQVATILNISEDKIEYGGMFISKREDETSILFGIGSFQDSESMRVNEVTFPMDYQVLNDYLNNKRNVVNDDSLCIYLTTEYDSDYFIYIQTGKQLSKWDQYLMEIFCSQVSAAFYNIHLTEEIENTQREVIFTLGEISEMRSKETGQHVKRVAEYAKLLGLKYGLSEEEAELIQLASPMHDIGKIGISDDIMNKPDRLTAEEYEIMKSHAQIGYEMLKHSERTILKAAAIIAHQHHEKYDGTGYPRGLKQEEIHLYGRITAIADVFDALASDRVYKKGWEMEEIVSLFKQERGKHFDPVLIDLFLEHLDDFIKIKKDIDEKSIVTN